MKRPAAQYLARYTAEHHYLWDELAAAAWLDPSIITKEALLYVDVDVSHGPTYGDTLTWSEKLRPSREARPDLQLVHVQQELDSAKFDRIFVELMKAAPVEKH